MKTTLNIDDTVMARLRQEAARQRKTMSELVEAGLRLLFHSAQQSKKKKLRPLPTFDGGKPRVDIADRNALYDFMEGRRQVFVVDSNVLLDAANRKSDFHEPCRRTLEHSRTRSSPWYISWPICYEFLRVSTHPHVFPAPWSLDRAWGFLQALLHSPSAAVLLPTSRHGEVLSEIIAGLPHLRGNILHDVHTAVLMREHGIKEIYTRDTDFHRFPFIKVIDPTA